MASRTQQQGAQILSPSEEVVEGTFDMSSLAILNKSEIEQQIATALAHPRSVTVFQRELLEISSLSKEVALEMFYSLPRSNKQVIGPSTRFAEVVVNTWGNCRAGARVVGTDASFISAQGVFLDLQKNVGISMEVRRRITDSKGNRFGDDMQGVTGNAAASIGFRNAVLRGVPKALWSQGYEKARLTAVGDAMSMKVLRESLFSHFIKLGVTEGMILNAVGVAGIEDVGADEVIALNTFKKEIAAKEKSLDDIFGYAQDAEVEAMMEQLGYNAGKKTVTRNAYKGRIAELLEFLKEQVAKNARVESAKVDANTKENATKETTPPTQVEPVGNLGITDADLPGDFFEPARPARQASFEQQPSPAGASKYSF